MQVEALGLATRAKVHWTEVWANDGMRSDATPLLDDTDGKYVFPVDGDSWGTANFVFGENSGQLRGDILSLRPAFSDGELAHTIVWVCGRAPAPRGFTVRGENETTIPASKLVAACRVRT